MTHIGFYLGGDQAVSAAGGGSGTTSYTIARKQGAEVKVHRVGYRKDLVGYRDVLRRVA